MTDLSVDNLNVSGISILQGDVYANNNLFVNSNTIIKGNLDTKSSINISGNTIMRGNIYALSGLNVNGLCDLQGNLNVKENLHVSGLTTLHNLSVGNINNVEDTINNKLNNDVLQNYYNKTETTTLFVPTFKSAEFIHIDNNLSIHGNMMIGNIPNIEETINSKASYSTLSNFYTKMEIDQKLNNQTNFSINDIDLNNLNITPNMFVNGYIRLDNRNTSTLILPSATQIINYYNLRPGITFITSISQVLGPLEKLYIQPTNDFLSTTVISLSPNQYTTETSILAIAPGFQSNYFTHHFITKIDGPYSMTIYKM